MTRGRYEVTALGEDDAPPRRRFGSCPCSRPVCCLLLLLLLLLTVVAAAVGAVFFRRAQQRNMIYTVDGSRLYRGGPNITEGDMLDLNTSSGVRSGALDRRLLWPLGHVPYRPDPDIGCPSSPRCEVLLSAVAEYNTKTCVQWRQPTDPQKPAVQIRYRPDSGCFSHVGYRGTSDVSQVIVLGNGCFNKGILLHLLGHTLGLWHEHNRPDRDSWININMNNVDESQTDSFRKFAEGQHHIVDHLDYSSVMMFGGQAFSNGGGPTMQSHWSGGPLREVWQKTELSEQDVSRVQSMYIRQCSRRHRPRPTT